MPHTSPSSIAERQGGGGFRTLYVLVKTSVRNYSGGMNTLDRSVTTVALRDELADVVGRVSYAHERVGVTRHGKLAAVVISVEDLELLEALEDARDAAEFRAAQAADDGTRVSLAELRDELPR